MRPVQLMLVIGAIGVVAIILARVVLFDERAISESRRAPNHQVEADAAPSRAMARNAVEARPGHPTKRARVSDADGAPVQGAWIAIVTDAGSPRTLDSDAVEWRTSDQAGFFDVPDILDTTARFAVFKHGYRLAVVSPHNLSVIALSAADASQMRIHNESGKGIAGAVVGTTVLISSQTRMTLPDVTATESGVAKLLVSEADVNEPALRIEVDVRHLGHATAERIMLSSCPVSSDGYRLVRLWEASPLIVEVVAGLPAGGADLAIILIEARTRMPVRIEPNGVGTITRAPKEATTALVFSESPEYDVFAEGAADSSDAYYPRKLSIIPGNPRRIRVAMGPRNGVIRGRVSPALSGVKIEARQALADAVGVGGNSAAVPLQSDGTFVLQGLRYGFWNLSLVGGPRRLSNSAGLLRRYPAPSPFARLNGQPTTRPTIVATEGLGIQVVLDATDPDVSIEWELARGGLLRGRVTDAAGAVVAGATISAMKDTANGPREGTGATGTDGQYQLSDLPPGSYALQVDHPRYRRAYAHRVEVRSEEGAARDFVMVAARSLELVLVDESGTGIPHVGIEVHEIVPPRAFTVRNPVEDSTTDVSGSARFGKLGTGDYVAKFPSGMPDGRTYESKTEIEFVIDDATTRLVFTLTPPLKVRGYLRDELGYPARKSLVWIVSAADTSKEIGGVTDEAGLFEIGVPVRGTYEVKRILVVPQSHEAAGRNITTEFVSPTAVFTDGLPQTCVFKRKVQ